MPEIRESSLYNFGGRVMVGPDKRQILSSLAEANSDPERWGIRRCRLCHHREAAVACYLPFRGSDIALRVKQPEGKTRAILYGLCRRCLRLPSDERHRRVEQAIRERHPRDGAGPQGNYDAPCTTGSLRPEASGT